ncbi:uncharacterized protein LOC132180570 [Corylus avellana]|uniref:uncharacterized protein LOC132180570 n=1 Tax=Corylus avellana TaxID=13451 RepID=UPI00286AF581|nr:uncharacterized protein LOC132180570 [Corylus avellana]
MAMGGYYKGNGGNNGGGGNRGRPYALMLLIAFGAALVGVMVLHKLRERRIFSLLLKEKDHQLLSLQLLLQNERDHSKEMKRKNEEMKAKIYSLRTQKMELDRRILEKQSTIDSLKDEQRAVESALEEKQKEIKMLREKEIDTGKENPQVMALMESLKQKEAEIEDLKHRTDDPSSPPVNLTENSQVSKGAEEGEKLHESAVISGENLTRSEDRSKIELNDFREAEATARVLEDGMQKPQESHDEGANNGGHAIEEPIDEGEGNKNEDSQEHDSQDPREIHKGGVKLEEADSSRMRGKHGHAGKTKGKRWRMLAKNRWLEKNGNAVNNEEVRKRGRQVFLDDEAGLRSRISNVGKLKREGVNNPMEVGKVVSLSDGKYPKNMGVKADATNQVVKGQETLLKNPHTSVNEEVQLLRMDAREQTLEEVRQPEEHVASDIQQQRSSSNVDEVENDAEDLEVAAADDDDHLIRESRSDVEEEYKEETDESEF